MEKNFNFTTAFVMKCNAEQFESVRSELVGMEYSDGGESHGCIYFVNNVDNIIGNAGLILGGRQYYYNRLVIETFNRDLCLALAAMTDKPDGIVGEWFKGSNGAFIQKKDDCDIASIATKATADELIKYFTEARPEQKQPEPDPQIEALQKRIEELEYNVKQLAESVQKATEPEPQPASRFADKQPLWAWSNNWKMCRVGLFWDAEYDRPYDINGKRNGFTYDNYEPIPADQIPAWMVDAAKHLED